MTSHELARKLLEGPDLQIFLVADTEGGISYSTQIQPEVGYFVNMHDRYYSDQYIRTGDEPYLGAIQGISL